MCESGINTTKILENRLTGGSNSEANKEASEAALQNGDDTSPFKTI